MLLSRRSMELLRCSWTKYTLRYMIGAAIFGLAHAQLLLMLLHLLRFSLDFTVLGRNLSNQVLLP